MRTRDHAVLLSLLVLAGCARPAAGESPKLGRPATVEEIAAWDISIPSDGSGLPAGRGRAADGVRVYAAKCQSCHGEKGAGHPNDRLVGGQGTLASKTPVKTVGS